MTGGVLIGVVDDVNFNPHPYVRDDRVKQRYNLTEVISIHIPT